MNTVYHSQQFNVYWTHFEYTFTSLQQDGTCHHRRSARRNYFLINVQMYELNEPARRWHASLPCTCRRMRMAAQSHCNHFDWYLVGVIIVLSEFFYFHRKQYAGSWQCDIWGGLYQTNVFSPEIKIWRFVNAMLFCDTFCVLKCKKKSVFHLDFVQLWSPTHSP